MGVESKGRGRKGSGRKDIDVVTSCRLKVGSSIVMLTVRIQ